MDNITQQIKNLEFLSYTDKLLAYNHVFTLGQFSQNIEDKFTLISLMAFLTKKMRERDPDITPLTILMKLTDQEADDSGFYQFLEALSIVVEDLSYGCIKFNLYGCKTSQEIINKIKELLNTWLPF